MTSQGASDFVGRRVKDARTARGWTAKDLAARCAAVGAPGITTAVVANIETGRRDKEGHRRREVTVDELLTLAYAFDVSPAALLGTGDWATERVAITAADGELAATDVAAWVAGRAPAPVRSLLGGGLARCASCGSELWFKRRISEGQADGCYHCINEECPEPVTCRASFLDAYVKGAVLGIFSNVADDLVGRGVGPLDGQRWEMLALSARQRILRALLERVTVSPQAESEQGFNTSSVLLAWAWESAEADRSEADA